MKRLATRMLIPIGFFAALLLYWKLFPSRDPIGMANGVYTSVCCGSLVLHDGVLRFDDTNVGYVVEHDKVGKYVLPDRAVGVINGSKVAITKSVEYIRLSDSEQQRRLTVMGTDRDGSLNEYSFVEGTPRR